MALLLVRLLVVVVLLLTNCTHLVLCIETTHRPIFNVKDFGVIGNGKHDDTLAMQALVSRQHSIVVVPANTTVKTGPLTLASNLLLQIDGTLQALDVTPRILDSVWPRLQPLELYNVSEDAGQVLQYQALLYANNVTNIRITGRGMIDGRGEAWWNLFHNNVTALKAGRPNLIQIVHSTNIEVDSVVLQDSPFWTLHPVLCENVHVHHVAIKSRLYAPNVDGIDPDSCRNVVLEHNNISCGDDHVAIKAGRCGDGMTPNKCTDPVWKSGKYQSSNITVRYNVMRAGMGISVGSESSGSIRNVDIHHNIIGLCEFGDDGDNACGWGPALHVKTTMSRGGTIEDVMFHDNIVYNTSMFILLEMDYQQGQHPDPPKDYAPTAVRNISFIRNSALGGAVGVNFACSKYDTCKDIRVIDNTIKNAKTLPWNCHFVESYNVFGNVPSGLEECMANSMNESRIVFDATES